ncbi:Cna B-type domain-containing protein [Leuconostoc inhae]|uniref:Cna B-type domain-containing protein n=1 Tax=Leuconostoc inhae TaxID=178001 RepID=UPI001C7D999C|nr:Cna B-type domain-containing protein [Leuconostoc inhae]
MLKKITTYFSLVVIISTFLATPITVMAESTNSETMSKVAPTTGESNSSVETSSTTKEEQITREKSTSESKQRQSTIDSQSNKSEVKISEAKPRAPSFKSNKDWGEQFITKSELEDKDGNPQTHFGLYDDMQAHWEFDIPAGTNVVSGDTMTVNVPGVFTLANDVLFDIKDVNGNVIGHAKADHKTGKVTVTLTDYAETAAKNGIAGSMNIWVHWDMTQVDQDTIVPVDWGTNGKTDIDIDPGNDPVPPDEKLYKWGWYDENDPTTIHWRVRLNYAKSDVKNTVYTDFIGENQTLISSSIQAYHVVYDSEGANFTIASHVPQSDVYEDGSTEFHINLHDISDTVVVDYETKIMDEGNAGKYENSGTLTGDNIEKQTVDVYSPNNGGGGDGKTKTSVDGTKTWDDQNNQDGIRPDSITVHLLANGKEVTKKTVTAKDNWKYSFTGLPKFDENEKEIVYTITENVVPSYNTETNGYNLTNHYTPGKTSVTVTKRWDDKNNQDGVRPEAIKVQLYADSKAIGSAVTLNDGNKWTNIWNNLPKKVDGKAIVYTVKEVGKIDGYEATVSDDNPGNIIITNKHVPETPVNPIIPDDPLRPETPVKPIIPVKPVIPLNQSVLPHTSANSAVWCGVYAMLFVGLVGALIYLSRKRNEMTK